MARIVTFDGDLPQAGAGEAITIVLKDEIDISRGDLLVDAASLAAGGTKRQHRRRVDGGTGAVAGPEL